MLTSLMSPTKDATAMMEKLGVSLYDSEGNMRSLNDVFIDLRDGMNSLATQAERDQVITSIFNARDMKAAEAMIAGVGDRYEELSGKIDDAAEAAQDMANTQLDNLQGDITLFKSAVEGAQIAVSDRLSPTLRKFTQFGSKAVSEMSKGFGKNGLTGAMEALHLTIDKELGSSAKAVFAVESAVKGAVAAFLTYQAVVKGTAVVETIIATAKAIQAATTAQEAFNAVTEANPYAAIAAAIVAAGVAVKSFIDAQTDAIDVTVDGTAAMTEEQIAFVESIKETTKAVQDGLNASKDRMTQTNAEAEETKNLFDQLWRLNDMEELSVSQKAKMAAIVTTLNERIEGLNLQFDEQTGKVLNNKEAVDKLMESYLAEAKVEAARENLVELMKQQITAEKQYNEVNSERNKLVYRRNELLKSQQRLQKIVDNHEDYSLNELADAKDKLRTVSEELSNVEDHLTEVNVAYIGASSGLRATNEEIEDMSDIIGKSAEEIAAENQAIEDSTAAVAESVAETTTLVGNAAELYYDKINGIAGITMSLNNNIVDLSGDTAESIGTLLDTYDQLVEKQKSAIESSVDFFGGFEKDTSTTFEDLWNNLSSVNDGMTDWADGIEALGERNISGALLQELKDMGLNSYNYVYDLCHATDEQLQQYSDLWDATTASVQDVTDRMVAGQKETIESQLRELAGVPTGHIEDFKEAYYDMGIAGDEGFEKGVHDKLAEAAKAGKDLASEAIDETTAELDAHSPSRRFEEIGRCVASGFALGMNDENVMSEIATAARNMANEAIASVRETLEEHSPSKVLRKIGDFFSEGFALGINDNAGMVEESALAMANSAIESAYVEPEGSIMNTNAQSNGILADNQAVINLNIDGQSMATVLAPLLDVISGREIMIATRGRQL